MRAIIGVDAKEAYKPALNLLARMDFPNVAVTLLHAACPVVPYVPAESSDSELQNEYMKAMQKLGAHALEAAADDACARDIPARTKMVFGPAASSLIDEVEAQSAELVAVAATHQGVWTSSFLGSVSRALAVACPVSVLVAKGEIQNGKTLKAVFATDHSPFSARCLERFIALKPKGISEIHVVSAYSVDDHEAEIFTKNLPMLGGDVDRWIEEQVETNNEITCKKLNAAGYATTSRAVKGRANDVIRQAMHDTSANVLLVGSHGKGFIERTFIGSVSLHQVVAEPYPVLVIRP